MGVIDTLSAGFDRITRRLWLVLLPALVDVVIWNGPRISVGKLSQELARALPAAAELGAQYEESLALAREWLTSAGGQANLLSLLSMRILGLPSLSASSVLGGRLLALGRAVFEVESWAALLGVVCLLTFLSLLLGCLGVSSIAQEVRDEEQDIGYAVRVAGRSWLRLSGLVTVTALCVAAIALGVSVAYTTISLVSPQLAALLFTGLMLGVLWVSVYVGVIALFVPRALILDDVGIRHSLWSSADVVRRNLLPAIVFFFLANVIQAGLMHVWRLLSVNAAGTLVGILGNAYVSAGLVAASLIFYRDRVAATQQAGPQAKTGGGQP